MILGTLQFTQVCQKQNKGRVGAPGIVHNRAVTRKLKGSTWTIYFQPSAPKTIEYQDLNDIAKDRCSNDLNYTC